MFKEAIHLFKYFAINNNSRINNDNCYICNTRRRGLQSGFEVTDLDGDGEIDFAAFAGARSGLLGDDDIAEAASAMEPGTIAVLIVYENAWAAPFVSAAMRNGGQMIATTRIPVEDIIATLDALESAE